MDTQKKEKGTKLKKVILIFLFFLTTTNSFAGENKITHHIMWVSKKGK